MSHSEITELFGVVGAPVDHGHAEILGVAGFVGTVDHGHAEVTGVSGFVGAATIGHAEFTGIAGVVAIPTVLQARAGNDFSTASFTDVALDGSASTGAWVSATWTLLSDSRVAAAAPFPTVLDPINPEPGTSSAVIMQFPAHPATYTAVLQLTVTDGVTISTDTVTVTVWAWVFWRVAGSALIPRVRYRFAA